MKRKEGGCYLSGYLEKSGRQGHQSWSIPGVLAEQQGGWCGWKAERRREELQKLQSGVKAGWVGSCGTARTLAFIQKNYFRVLNRDGK